MAMGVKRLQRPSFSVAWVRITWLVCGDAPNSPFPITPTLWRSACAGECWNQGCLVLHREAVSRERERLEESFWLACHQAWSQTRAAHQLGLTVLVCNPSSWEAQVERSGVQGHLWLHSKLKFKAGLGSSTLSQTKTTVRHGQKQLYFPIKTGSQLTSQTVDGTKAHLQVDELRKSKHC